MINVRFDGIRQIDVFLGGLEQELLDFRPLWSRLLDRVVIAEIRQVFASDGRGRWPARRDNLPHPLLRKSGRLYRSLTQPGGPDNIHRQSRTRLEFGTSVPYADVHERGSGRVPARPVIGFLAEDSDFERRLEREIDDYFQSKINRLGG